MQLKTQSSSQFNEFIFIPLRLKVWPPQQEIEQEKLEGTCMLHCRHNSGSEPTLVHLPWTPTLPCAPQDSPTPPWQTQLLGPSDETKTIEAHESKCSTNTNLFCMVRCIQKFLTGWICLSRPQARSDTTCWGCRELVPAPAPALLCRPAAGRKPEAGTQPA